MVAKARWNIFVTRHLPGDAIERLRKVARVEVWDRELPPPRDYLLKKLRSADAILSMLSDRMDEDAIASAPELKVISNYAVGVDNIDLEAATRGGIPVGHTPGVLTDATADIAFGLLMAAARRIVEGDREVRAGKWQTWGPEVLLGNDVHGATLGIIGWGAIGQATARRGEGFGMKILYLKPRGKSHRVQNGPAPAGTPVTLARLLRESDFVSIHVPLTPETRHLLGKNEFALMKPGAILINTARGPIVDQKALTAALKSRHLGGTGLDVTDPEPIERGDPLLKLPNVVIAPHIGSASRATRERMTAMAVDNILAVMKGSAPEWCANPEVKSTFKTHRSVRILK
ncbi:MAG TPA: D-glycerate dehydrogenase [Candidatus Binataceae bacterium]|nr:D-glycerate dehydrogenase [Candidatus Binataceae bacterium]